MQDDGTSRVELQCGGVKIDVTGVPLVAIGEWSVGCWICGRGDLFDLGFRHVDIVKFGVQLLVDGVVIAEFRQNSGTLTELGGRNGSLV